MPQQNEELNWYSFGHGGHLSTSPVSPSPSDVGADPHAPGPSFLFAGSDAVSVIDAGPFLKAFLLLIVLP
ncbi:hypothetical protein ARTSIC4J27_88 [Pseudarthrobacter siccitolerans]|uniref:Uncharacterized protein n=1 Tax=Pseudarthrobacter siccitolerans TaxID=861266 RepID=A0A024GXE2_9MICC|nr:hypothetical protein ARTSIC4J27_88 [Pseudarthrobacter siccitolerans]